MEFYLATFYVFILIFVRVMSLLSSAPFFGLSVIPFQLRFWLSLFLSYIFLLTIKFKDINLQVEILGFVVLILKEIMIGLIIGFSSWGIFYAVQFAGHLIGFNIGFSASAVFDPEHSEPVPILSQFKNYFAVVIFLMLNGHHFLIRVLKVSFELFPVANFGISSGLVNWGVKLISFVFISAVKISAPVIVALFLTDITIGVLSRAFPQMNIFMFAFSVKIITGLIVLMVTMPFFIFVFKKLLLAFESDMFELLKVMSV